MLLNISPYKLNAPAISLGDFEPITEYDNCPFNEQGLKNDRFLNLSSTK